ncbi:MAG: thioesterase family protein [Bacilli bacterium]
MNPWYEEHLRVRYQETDQMGVVYHANYLTWFEVGRTGFVRDFGLPYSTFEDKGVLLPVVEAHCYYKAPARYEDEIIIRSKLKGMTEARLIFIYEVVRKSDEKLLCTGETVHVWVNKEMRPVSLKKVLPEEYDRLIQIVEGEK